MKNVKKILALGLSVVMIFGMTACSFSSNKALTMDVETGDKIKVACDTSDGYSMKWDKEDDIMTVSEDKDTVLELIFADEDHIEEYCEAANGEVEVKDSDEHGGVVYTLFAAEDDDEEKYFIVGWIVGSDTGIIAEGTDSKKETQNAFKALTFTVEDTDQDDDDFYVEDVEEIESKGDEEDEKPADDNKDNKDEPDETKPEESKPEESKPDETEPEETQPKEDDDEDEIVVKPVGDLSTDWKDFQFEINGKVLSLPCTYKELKEATGYSIKSAEEKSYLEPNYYTSCQLRDADGNGVCYIDILNNTEEDMAYADGIVIEISQDDWDVEDHGIFVNFAGFKVGDVTSKDDLIAKFGNPIDVYEYRIDEDDDPEWKEYESDTYTWALDDTWTTMDFIEIKMNINTGIIEEIRLDHSGAIE